MNSPSPGLRSYPGYCINHDPTPAGLSPCPNRCPASFCTSSSPPKGGFRFCPMRTNAGKFTLFSEESPKTQLPAHFDRWSFRSCPYSGPVGSQRFPSRSGERTQARFQPLDSRALPTYCKICVAGGIRGFFCERIECGDRAHLHRKPAGTPCQGFFSG